MALTDKLKAIGNAIRAKTGGTEELTLDQMVTEIEGIEGGSGGGSGGFVTINDEFVNAPQVCRAFPSFRISSNIATVVAELSLSCTKVIEVDLLKVTTVKENAFNQCYLLETVNLPSAVTIEHHAFCYCGSLSTVNLPVVTSVGNYAFAECALTSIDLPSATSIGNGAFSRCEKLTLADLPAATSIGADAFLNCKNLSAIILRTTETVCVVDTSAILGTPIVNLQGFVYVPTVMYEYYRAGYSDALDAAFAEMGVTGVFDLLFRKIEDYPEICG